MLQTTRESKDYARDKFNAHKTAIGKLDAGRTRTEHIREAVQWGQMAGMKRETIVRRLELVGVTTSDTWDIIRALWR